MKPRRQAEILDDLNSPDAAAGDFTAKGAAEDSAAPSCLAPAQCCAGYCSSA
jgi:hypothetical protein